MFDDKRITKDKVWEILYSVENEFDNEIDDYVSPYENSLSKVDMLMLSEYLYKYVQKVWSVMKYELIDSDLNEKEVE